MWVFVGLAVFLIGFFPKVTGLSWVYLIYSFYVGYMGEILQLPDWMAKLSPFHHVPSVPAEEVEVATLLIITGVAILLIILGFVGYNRRDIE